MDNLSKQFTGSKFVEHPDFDLPDYDEEDPFTDGEISLKPKAKA
jgi:hypothetical protein